MMKRCAACVALAGLWASGCATTPSVNDVSYRPEAVAEFQVGHLSQAQERFQQALHRNPRDPFALYYMGRIACERREWEDAIYYLQCCLDADPSFYEARRYLALAEESAGAVGPKLRFIPDWPPKHHTARRGAASVAEAGPMSSTP